MDEKEIKIVEEKGNFKDTLRNLDTKKLLLPIIIFILFVGTVIGIINYQQKAKRERTPKLEISTPEDGRVFNEAQIVLEGNTYPDNKVQVNGENAAVDKDGKFNAEVPLKEGVNELSVVVENPTGKKAEKKIVVNRESVEPAEETPEISPGPTAPSAAATSEKLSSSGPENFWIPEILSLSGAGAAWMTSRKNLKKTLKK